MVPPYRAALKNGATMEGGASFYLNSRGGAELHRVSYGLWDGSKGGTVFAAFFLSEKIFNLALSNIFCPKIPEFFLEFIFDWVFGLFFCWLTMEHTPGTECELF